jgi:hypothetical protein
VLALQQVEGLAHRADADAELPGKKAFIGNDLAGLPIAFRYPLDQHVAELDVDRPPAQAS